MKIFKYICPECHYEEVLDEDFAYEYPDKCPKCGNEILLDTYISDGDGHYKVLALKKASNLRKYDLYFFRVSNEAYQVLGIRSITKKSKPVLNVGLKGYGSLTLSEDEIVYCVEGVWKPENN